jgi:NAD(P)H-nitrite reductase large subunit
MQPLPQRKSGRRSTTERNFNVNTTNANDVKKQHKPHHYTYVVVGGGIAGTEAAKTLVALSLSSFPSNTVALITPSLISDTSDTVTLTPHLQLFNIVQRPMDEFAAKYPQCTIVSDYVISVNKEESKVCLRSGGILFYKKLCIASGAIPKLLAVHPLVVGVRDPESAKKFETAIRTSRRICIVGNGAIALEAVGFLRHLKNVKLLWVSKQPNPTHVGNTFFDAGAGEFLCTDMKSNKKKTSDDDNDDDDDQSDFFPIAHCNIELNGSVPELTQKNLKWTFTEHFKQEFGSREYGSALGPFWLKKSNDSQVDKQNEEQNKTIKSTDSDGSKVATMVRECGSTVHAISNPLTKNDGTNETFAYVWLSCGKIYEVDLIVSAIGVIPNTSFLKNNFINYIDTNDGGLKVNAKDLCVTSNIYAAGDCASITSNSKHWMQMRLWSQARAQGRHVAMIMTGTAEKSYLGGFSFEIFAHHTTFWGYDVCLLGKFNQVNVEAVESGVGEECHLEPKKKNTTIEVLVRRSKDEFLKVILKNHRVIGAVIVGKDMEDAETFENLILNGTDVSGIDLLNPQLDLADYFD